MPLPSFRENSIDLDGKAILVTGGTGSFGKRFVRTVLERHKPSRLIIFSRDELKQYEMAQAFSDDESGALRFFIGDVREQDRLEMAMRGVDYVVHAAALKHVPTAEYNPFECIKTNIMGAENVVQAAIRCDVEKVLALSTDKAASPANLYGASKLAADKIFVAANNLSGADGTRFAAVRYGNVIGSRGSFVPLLQKLVADQAPSIPITDERMTRFWITLQQGVDFVLSSMEMMRGGEIFVPKIPSMRIVDLAECLAPGVPHRVTGIRPGEKLHELMVSRDDARATVDLPDRYVIEPSFAFWPRRNRVDDGAATVPEDFKYASNTNDQWLDAGDFKKLITNSDL
jgi:UDP-N-acetylglucosamine 4,6-dehydratase/5-epimerase